MESTREGSTVPSARCQHAEPSYPDGHPEASAPPAKRQIERWADGWPKDIPRDAVRVPPQLAPGDGTSTYGRRRRNARKPRPSQPVLVPFREPDSEPRNVLIQRLAYERIRPGEHVATDDVMVHLPIFRIQPMVTKRELFLELEQMAVNGLIVKIRNEHGFALWRRALTEGGGD
jgi:hypothetical protein